jgi:hypothetical protein
VPQKEQAPQKLFGSFGIEPVGLPVDLEAQIGFGSPDTWYELPSVGSFAEGVGPKNEQDQLSETAIAVSTKS